jgi:hypothetical protein
MELERDLSLQNIAEEDLSLFTEPVSASHPPADRHVRLYAQHANSIFDSPMTRLPLTALPGRRINLVERIAFCPRPHSLLAVIGSAMRSPPRRPTGIGYRL